jgi:hypothetical protein
MANTPGACPPGQVFDASTSDCVAACNALFQAYVAAVAGKTRVVVRFNERWTEYSKPDVPALLTLYQTLYAQCPAAKAAGLPDLNPNLKVQRGRPARGHFRWSPL